MANLSRILKIKSLNKLKPLVNIEGQNEEVKSIIVVDSPSFLSLLKGGEIVITSFYTLEDDLKIQKSFIRYLKKAGCVAVFIRYSQKFTALSQDIIELAKEISLPIYGMPDRLVYSNIINSINKLIFDSEHRIIAKEEYINNILYSDLFDERALESWGKDLGCKAVNSFTGALYIFIQEFNEDIEEQNDKITKLKYQFGYQIKKVINDLYTIKGSSRIGVISHHNGFSIFPAGESTEDILKIFKKIQVLILKMCEKQFPDLTVYMGISKVAEGLSGIRNGFKQAEFAVKMRMVTNTDHKVFYYDDFEIYDLFYKMYSKERFSYAKKILGEAYNNEILLETMWAYFYNNESLKRTGETLNIHSNTLKYRLNKIKEITNLDVKEINQKFKLYLAVLEYYLYARE